MAFASRLVLGLLLSSTALAGDWEPTGAREVEGGFTSSVVYVESGVVMDEENTGTHSTKKEARQAANDLAAQKNDAGDKPGNVVPDEK
jgi:hypothetical protein